MKITLVITALIFTISSVCAQITVSGTVTDKAGRPIVGANVYLEGTYDGTSTTENGTYTFETFEEGGQTLVVSALAYEPYHEMGEVSLFKGMSIQLVEAINQLTGVTLTAGTFEAGDNSKVTALKPLDIVTTAGAMGDVVAALQTLPGTTTVNEDGRLFVRGGRAEETQVFIDGLRVFQPFNASANNMPTRGRFSPFLFKGITFSTGGYSAEYGQALSSVLLLKTTDLPDQEKTDVQAMSVGAGLGHTKIWGNTSLSFNAQYLNLSPYEELIPSTQGMRWNKPYESIAGEAVFRVKGDKGIFKFYTGFNRATFDIDQEDINYDDFVRFRLNNGNLYLNTSYIHFFDKGWTVFSGASISNDTNDINIINDQVAISETASHIKATVKKGFSNRFEITAGGEIFNTHFRESYTEESSTALQSGYDDTLVAGFVESDVFFSNDFALKLGGRVENASVLGRFSMAPRLSLAYKSGQHGQFSLAYGDFYQNPLNEVLKYEQALGFEKTSHHLLNYQYVKDGKTFRAEAYYKRYRNLVTYDTELPELDSQFTNLGFGHAAGMDLFWRDNKSINNLDYWASYSYLNTEREYRNFPEAATPNFAPTHNFSLVGKYWVDKLRSQIGASYSFATGRPYNDPNSDVFMGASTRPFHNISINWAYLIDQQKILYFSVNNVLGFNNISNYQYADTPNADGVFDRRAITPPADSFAFIGFFWTLSADNKSNQLDNL